MLSPPSGCAEAFFGGEADIALVPVGSFSSFPFSDFSDFDIVTSWCIGASGPVRTVVLVSDSPLTDIKRVWLDPHSMTSVRLAQVLAAKFWGISPRFVDFDWQSSAPLPPSGGRCEFADANSGEPTDAFVLIGDKVLENEGRFRYSWDLADEWERYTGLPFVFAVWVARKGVPEEVIVDLEDALTLGVERIYEAVIESDFADRPYAYEYLTKNIDYFFDAPKRRALERFLDECKSLADTALATTIPPTKTPMR